MRRGVKLGGLMVSLVAVLAAGLVVAPVAQGVATCLRAIPEAGCGPRPTPPEISISVKPTKLPRETRAPIAVEASATFHDGVTVGMPTTREMVVEIDRQVSIDAEGLPSCGARRLLTLDRGEARRACREAIVGSGTASVVLAPEGQQVTIPLTLFNGGVRDGTTTLLVHSPIVTGTPEVLLATAKVSKRDRGPYGWQAVVRIPPIAGGSGSLSSFNFELGRSFGYEGGERNYLSASCRLGRLLTRFTKIVLKNEVNTPGLAPTTEMTGGVVTPCRPTG